MKRLILHFFTLMAVMACRNANPPDLSTQLKNDLSARLIRVDSFALIDSFKVMHVDTVVPRLGKIIDDTIYIRQLRSVQEQLTHAKTRPRKDSIEYFQGEVDYMTVQIDSITATIKTEDTTKKFGILAGCYYRIRKNDKLAQDSIYYFIQTSGQIINSEMLDSFMVRTYRNLK